MKKQKKSATQARKAFSPTLVFRSTISDVGRAEVWWV